jgi:type VI secretion system secreted protein Hcp
MRIVPQGRLFVLSTVIAVLLSAVPAYAAIDAYMTIKSSKQGGIKGDSMSDQIRLVNVVRDSPMSAAMPTGRRMHSTITITKEIDKSSPMLAQAASTHEPLSEVAITFVGGASGAKTAQKIVLTNAVILSVRKAGNNEQVTFDYQGIDVHYAKGGVTAADDWETPNN